MRTVGLVAFSTGWIIPFAWSVLVTHWFIDDVVWGQVRHLLWPESIVQPLDSFHVFFVAHYVFAFSMVWLFAVISFWVIKYARATRPVEKPE